MGGLHRSLAQRRLPRRANAPHILGNVSLQSRHLAAAIQALSEAKGRADHAGPG